MLYAVISKKSRILITAIFMSSLSFSLIKSEDCIERGKNHFDVRDINIGYPNSPVNQSSIACRAEQALEGETTTLFTNSVISPTIAVSPDNRRNVVAAWQQGVTSNGGNGLEIGIAHSQNGGRSWRRSLIPVQSCIGGVSQSVNSIDLSYGPNGRVFIIASVTNISENPNTLNQSGIITSSSADNGRTWSNPQFLAASSDFFTNQDLTSPLNVKPTITADPNNPNIAYATWSNFPEAGLDHANSFVSSTIDGGLTWGDSSILYDPSTDEALAPLTNGIYNDVNVTGNTIVTLPNGNLLNFMTRRYASPTATNDQFINDVWPYQYSNFDIAVTRSMDNGLTWSTEGTSISTVDANATFTNGYTYGPENTITGGMGLPTSTQGSNQFFDVIANPTNGNLYTIWQSGQFSPNQLPQIALSTSRDGGATWSEPVRISRTPLNAPNPQAFTASLAIDDNNHVGILYYDYRNDDNLNQTSTKTDVWFAEYKEVSSPTGGTTGVGLEFVRELRVSENSYIMQNGPQVNGQFITNGDYNDLAAQGNDFYAIYVKSAKGPFTPATTIVDNLTTSTVLLADNNRRTAPYFSRIDA